MTVTVAVLETRDRESLSCSSAFERFLLGQVESYSIERLVSGPRLSSLRSV